MTHYDEFCGTCLENEYVYANEENTVPIYLLLDFLRPLNGLFSVAINHKQFCGGKNTAPQ